MPPVEPIIQYWPPAAALIAVIGGLIIRFLKHREGTRRSEWDRMRDLLDELRGQRDHLDQLATSLGEDNARLRRENADLRRRLDEEETP